MTRAEASERGGVRHSRGVLITAVCRDVTGGLPVTNSGLFSGTAKYTDLRPLPVPMNLIIMMSRINTQTQNLGQEAANIL